MANVQIPNLPAVVAVSGQELVEAVQGGTSVKVSIEQIGTYIGTTFPVGVTEINTTAPITGGPITSTGSIGIATGGIVNSLLANMAALTIKANTSGVSAAPADRTLSEVLNAMAGTAQGSILFRNSTDWTALTLGSAGQILTSNGTTAVWTTPSSAGTVTSVDASGGTTGLTFSGGPITSSGTITMSGTLAIANGGTGATSKAGAFDALSPMTSVGDLILGGASGTGTRLAIGANGYVLRSNGTTAAWSSASSGTVTSVAASGGSTGLTFSGSPITSSGTLTLGGTLDISAGGTGATTKAAAFDALSPMTTLGDIIVGGASGSGSRLGIGSVGQVLTVSGGTAAWVTPGTGGTVTSVAASGGTTGLTFSGSPITTSGTLTLGGTLAVANGGTGGTTQATARTALGLGTIATQDANSVSITGGTITGITDLAVADGGTGASTLTGYVKGNGTSAMTASATIPNTDITGLGTMSTQASSNVAITGGSIQNTTIGGVGVSAVGTFTTLTASTNLIALGTSTLGTANTDTVTANGMVYFVGGTRENIYTVTSTTPDFNPNDGGIVQWNLSANSTPVSPTNWLNGQSITLRISDGTAYTINWTTMGVVWVGGTAPTLATTGYTIVVLFKIGGVIYGSTTGNVA